MLKRQQETTAERIDFVEKLNNEYGLYPDQAAEILTCTPQQFAEWQTLAQGDLQPIDASVRASQV
ncbi:MAG: hypothetical protein ACOH5I_21970 [Oligoflexus sp.]